MFGPHMRGQKLVEGRNHGIRENNMSNRTNRIVSMVCSIAFALGALACSPKVGSDAWCAKMKETPKGDWSANDAADFAKHCVFK
jgi:hypothetical protein